MPVQNIKFCTGILLYIKNNYLSIDVYKRQGGSKVKRLEAENENLRQDIVALQKQVQAEQVRPPEIFAEEKF